MLLIHNSCQQIITLLTTKRNEKDIRLFFGAIGTVTTVASCASYIFGAATSTQALSGAFCGVTIISGAITGYVALIALPIIVGVAIAIALSPTSVILIPGKNPASSPIPTNPLQPPFALQPVPIDPVYLRRYNSPYRYTGPSYYPFHGGSM